MGRGKKNRERSEQPKRNATKSGLAKVRFDNALSNFKRNNIEKALLMKDKEAMKLWAKKQMPSMEATQEDWDQLLEKF